MALTKKYWILISLIVILLGGTLVYFDWTKQKSGPACSPQEQTKAETTRQIMIPSSLDSDDVIAQFVPYMPPIGGKLTRDDPFWNQRFEITSLNEGFTEGFTTAWSGNAYYLTKSGHKLGGESHSYVLDLSVLKYKSHDFAQKDYARISVKQGFEDIILKGIKLKSKVGLPPEISQGTNSKVTNLQQCLLYSDNFIIYAFGLKEAAKDIIIRLIDRYAVK